jgi:excisionase family DNA binding protein
MTMLWSCPQAECPPTDKPPRDVEEPAEVADGESQGVLSIEEVAKLLRVPVSAIYAWNRRGVGPPHYKVGRKLRYRKSNARNWLAEHLVSRAVCSSECGGTYRLNAFTTVEDDEDRQL